MKRVKQVLTLSAVFVAWVAVCFGCVFALSSLAGPVDLGSDAIARRQEMMRQPTQDVTIGKAVVRTYADGGIEVLSGPLILPGTTNGAFEVLVISDGGVVLGILDHASPRKTKAEKDAAKAAKLQTVKAIKAATTDKEKFDLLLALFGLK